MTVDLVYSISLNGVVILGLNVNDYIYSTDNVIINLLKKYKKVQFDDNYNCRIDWLPEGITEIYLGAIFNQPLENLPSTTKKIVIQAYQKIGYTHFNQPLDYLPCGLEEFYMYFNQAFNHPLNNLPSGLKKLQINGYYFAKSINNLPDSLEEINIPQFDCVNTYKLPDSLKIFTTRQYPEYKNHQYETLQNKYPNVKFMYSM